MRINNFENKKFGYLTVIKKTNEKTKHNNSIWLCKCDCGNKTKVAGGNLKSGHTISCGCARGIANKKIRTTHGMTHTTQYLSWVGLKARCNNKNNNIYKNYGGRGIKVCERWQNSFINFWADMGSTWKEGLTIDRIDNNGDYEPGNCRWATRKQQANNKRNNDWITFDGKTKTLSQWAHDLGWEQPFLRKRIYVDGWSIKKALTAPKRKMKKCYN